MIRVLQNWDEVGAAVCSLQRENLPLYESPQKNWDHWLLRQAVRDLARNTRIVDLGCGDGFTLSLLHALGFRDLTGVDLLLGKRARLLQLARGIAGNGWHRPYRLRRASMTATGLPAGTCGMVASVSAVEHGVDLSLFFPECRRILCHRGLLFMTTDFWEPSVPAPGDVLPYGQPWRIFDAAGIEELVRLAADAHLSLADGGCGIAGRVGRPVLAWHGREYTSASLLFRRSE